MSLWGEEILRQQAAGIIAAGTIGQTKQTRSKLFISAATVEDHVAGNTFMALWNKKTRTKERVQEKYREFCSLSELPLKEGLQTFVGRMINCQLSAGTINVYVGFLKNLVSPSLFWNVRRATQLAHADAETRSAVSITTEVAEKIISSLSRRTKAIVYLMFVTGARAADLIRLRGSQIKVTESRVVLEFRIMKHRRRRGLRTFFASDAKMIMQPPSDVLRFFKEISCERSLMAFRPFAGMTASTINNSIRAVAQPESKISTYSFRKLFINLVLAKNKGDLSKVAHYTKHFRTSTLEAYYQRAE
jgi:site-specific recombinase XerD